MSACPGASAGRASVRYAEDPDSSPGPVNFSLHSLIIIILIIILTKKYSCGFYAALCAGLW